MTAFFNLFGEVEPFTAILIAHRTVSFGRRLLRLVGRNLRPKAESVEQFSGGGSEPLSPLARESGGAL